MKKALSLLLALLLLVAFALSLAGCGSARREAPTQTVDITPEAGVSSGTLDFAIRLYRAAYNGNNTLLSPLSVLAALAMTANGAAGKTKAQMENVLGATIEELNAFFTEYLANLPNDETCKLALADAIWIRNDDRLAVKDAFLGTCADVYRAAAYRTPFDREAVDEINGWVSEKTDGVIKEILDGVPEGTLNLLILNALAFDAEWASPYVQESDVRSGSFTKENGKKVEVEYLADTEHLYLTDGDRAVGFIKPYADGRYAFAALLPAKGIALADYLATLDGERIAAILNNRQSAYVETKLPKFEVRSDLILNEGLRALGMNDAFLDGIADFSEISDSCDHYISRVQHKTYIEVGERGTRAAAVTGVFLDSYGMKPDDVRTVTLDRPFVYLIYDVENNLPLFIGTLNDPNG